MLCVFWDKGTVIKTYVQQSDHSYSDRLHTFWSTVHWTLRNVSFRLIRYRKKVITVSTVLPHNIYRPHGITVNFFPFPRQLPWLPRYYCFPHYRVILYSEVTFILEQRSNGQHSHRIVTRSALLHSTFSTNSTHTFSISRTCTKLAERAFSISGPTARNSIPLHMYTTTHRYSCFKATTVIPLFKIDI